MPKVTKEYIDKKKAEIISAAKEVFKRKTLYDMNMMDIIKEAGLSKGGIYRYYKDIDDIIIELINNESSKHTYSENIHAIVNSNENEETKIKNLFSLYADHIDKNIDTLGKMQFELTILEANDAVRSNKILTGLNEYSDGRLLINALYEEISKASKNNSNVNLEHIYDYVKVYVEGLIKIQVFERCYHKKAECMNVEAMMDMLSNTIINMIKQ